MKIWCERCNGTGQIDEGIYNYEELYPCDYCKGKGYVKDIEIDNKIKLADAIEFAFNYGLGLYDVEYDYDYDDNPIDYYKLIASSKKHLINWYEDYVKDGV